MKKRIEIIGCIAFLAAFIVLCFILTPITQAVGSLWALLPPVIAIGLALITKEVYSSLFIGIVSGGILYAISSGTGFSGVMQSVVQDGFLSNIANVSNAGIMAFLVILGTIVVLINKAGGSYAYGEWASRKIHSRRGANLATAILGVCIFVDDYFNCLTVGSVMRPITDRTKVSRAKLAYLIDSTAAPICIIAPISSWATAVSSSVEGVNGLQLFICTIPYNLYALLTICMVFFLSATNLDYGPMRYHEQMAQNGIQSSQEAETGNPEGILPSRPGAKIVDLMLPIGVLIAGCILGMLYTGGLFEGADIIDAFSNCDAPLGLTLGSLGALIFIIFYFLCRRLLRFTECMESIVEGFRQMVPAMLILVLAWTLKSVTNQLDAGTFVSFLVQNASGILILLPVLLFVVAIALSFATGTSWGTFGILIPIVISVFHSELAQASGTGNIPSIVVICVSACLAGAVCGDHCSPISDTTIMASAGAQCKHIDHVSTQLPYILTVAGVCVIGYVIAGLVQNVFLVLGSSILLLFLVLIAIKWISGRKQKRAKNKAE